MSLFMLKRASLTNEKECGDKHETGRTCCLAQNHGSLHMAEDQFSWFHKIAPVVAQREPDLIDEKLAEVVDAMPI